MPSEPLQPFSPPSTFMFAPGALSQAFVVEWFGYTVFGFWAVYTGVTVYHWLKYSHASLIAIPAIIMHLGVSFILVVYILSGTLFL